MVSERNSGEVPRIRRNQHIPIVSRKKEASFFVSISIVISVFLNDIGVMSHELVDPHASDYISKLLLLLLHWIMSSTVQY